MEFDRYFDFLNNKWPWHRTVERRGGLATGLAGAFLIKVPALDPLAMFFKDFSIPVFRVKAVFSWEVPNVFLFALFCGKKDVAGFRKKRFSRLHSPSKNVR